MKNEAKGSNQAESKQSQPLPLNEILPPTVNLDEPEFRSWFDVAKLPIEQTVSGAQSDAIQRQTQAEIDAAAAAYQQSLQQSSQQKSQRTKSFSDEERASSSKEKVQIDYEPLTKDALYASKDFIDVKTQKEFEFERLAHETLIEEFKKQNGGNFEFDYIEAKTDLNSPSAKFLTTREQIKNRLLNEWETAELDRRNAELAASVADSRIAQYFKEQGYTDEEIAAAKKHVVSASKNPVAVYQEMFVPAMMAYLSKQSPDPIQTQRRERYVSKQTVQRGASPYSSSKPASLANEQGKAFDVLESWIRGDNSF